MSGVRPEKVIDPVCGMPIHVRRAEAAGLTVEHEARTFAFCGSGCLRAFREEPESYAASAALASSASATLGAAGSTAVPVIDEGMRRWYESCSCCLSEAYPEIKAALDAERAAANDAPVGAGAFHVADAAGAHEQEEVAIQ